MFYTNTLDSNYILASSIQNSLKLNLGNANREVVKRDNIYLLNHSLIPTELIECGVLSNKKERELLINEDYQIMVAYAIVNGVKGAYL